MVAKNPKIKKRANWDTVFSVLLTVLFFCVIAFFIYSNWKINKKREEMTSRIESLKKEVQILEDKNEKLKASIDQTQSEYFQEAKAREQGYKKPGEEAVVVLKPDQSLETQEEQPKTFWQKVSDFFNSFVRK